MGGRRRRAVSHAPDPAHPGDLLLIADQPGDLTIIARVREGLTERRATKTVTAVPEVADPAPPFTLRLFLHGWGLVVVAVLIVGFAGALDALGNFTSSDFIALAVPLAALLGVIAVARGSGSEAGGRPGNGHGKRAQRGQAARAGRRRRHVKLPYLKPVQQYGIEIQYCHSPGTRPGRKAVPPMTTLVIAEATAPRLSRAGGVSTPARHASAAPGQGPAGRSARAGLQRGDRGLLDRARLQHGRDARPDRRRRRRAQPGHADRVVPADALHRLRVPRAEQGRPGLRHHVHLDGARVRAAGRLDGRLGDHRGRRHRDGQPGADRRAVLPAARRRAGRPGPSG